MSHTNFVEALPEGEGGRTCGQSGQRDDGNRTVLSKDGTAWTRPGLHHPDPSLHPPVAGRASTLGATSLTLGSPGPGARVPQPCLLPGWIRQSPRTCWAGRLRGGAGASTGAALCRLRTGLQQDLVWLWQGGSAAAPIGCAGTPSWDCLGLKPRVTRASGSWWISMPACPPACLPPGLLFSFPKKAELGRGDGQQLRPVGEVGGPGDTGGSAGI